MIYRFTDNPEIIKDRIIGIVKFSENVAIQAIESAKTVINFGLESADAINDKANTVILNSFRKTLGTGNILGNEARESFKNMVKDTIRNTKEIFELLAKPKSEDANVDNSSQ